MTILTMKVPDALDKKIKVLARKLGTTKSSLIRKAMEKYLSEDIGASDEPTTYELISDFVGSIQGPPDLSCGSQHMQGYGE